MSTPKHRLERDPAFVTWLPSPSPVKRFTTTTRDWIAAEWKPLAAYLIGAALVFVGVLVSQHYWPDETMAAWGSVWRIALILVGANAFVLILLEISLRGVEKRDSFEDADGNCTICGSGFNEPCKPVAA